MLRIRLALLASLALCIACEEEVLDTTRIVPDRGTLGEEIFRLFHRDFVREDQRIADGFMLEHDGIVGAIDHIFPPDELSYTQDFLVKLIPLQDDGTLPNATRLLAGVTERLTEDQDALRSLAACNHRVGYVSLAHEQALIRRIAHYPQYKELIKAMIRLHLSHDGLDESGQPDASESDAMTRLSRLMSQRLSTLELSEDTERGIVLAADFLLREDARFAEGMPALNPQIVARDVRGMAKVRAPNGQVGAPFVDQSPRDGLPDVDLGGQFVGSTGTPLDLPPFGAVAVPNTVPNTMRDQTGRLVTMTGEPIFEYVDLERTILSGVLRDTRQLIHDGIPIRAVRTLDAVLGDRLPDGTYGSENSGLLDLVHAIGAAGDTDALPEVLNLLRTLVENHEATAMWLALETEAQMDVADRYNVNLKQGSSFFNDLMNTLRKILRVPGLAEDMLVALRDPAIANLPEVQIRLLSHKKERITPADVAAGTIFQTPVDRSQPDVAANASLQQRMLHLVYDTKGVRYEPRLVGIPLGFIFQIDDLAEFYMLSIIGRAEIPSLVSTLTGLSTQPTPQELAVFLNEDQTFGNPVGRDGLEVKDNDGDTLFAVTESGMADVLRPLIQVFYDRGQLDLLLELFEVLHLHWATAQSGYQDQSQSDSHYSHLSGIRSYEPLLIDGFQNTRVLDAVRKLLDETVNVRTQRGRAAHDTILLFARKLLDKDPNLRARDGKREVIFDGERITPLSPFDLIRFSRARIKGVIRRSAATQADWDAVVDALHRTFLQSERTGPESGRLKNPRALPFVAALLSFMEERAAKHEAARDLSDWITEDLPQEVEDAITAPEVPALFDVIYAIDADQGLTDAIGGLRDELLDEQRGFPDLLVTSGDLVSTMKDASIAMPLVRFLGRELDPDKQTIFTLYTLTTKTLAIDSDEHFLEVVRRSIDDAPDGRFYAYGLTGAIRQVHRVNPLDTSIPSADDLLRITAAVGRYLVDDEHGLEKFYHMVKHRKREDLEGSR